MPCRFARLSPVSLISELPRAPRPEAPPLRPGRPEAAAAIWDWRGERAPAPLAPSTARLRLEGLVRSLVGAAIGTAVFFLWHRNVAYVVWASAALTLLAAMASPTGAYAALGRGLAAFGRAVGRVLTVVLLTPVFLLFFLPFRLLLRGGRRDRLERWFDRELPSYWKRRDEPERTKASYERQF